jgi:hypothetical protein
MHERIGKLAEAAGLIGPSSRIGNSHEATERFAELLLDEFIEALDKYNGHHSEMSEYGLSILIGYIRIHFGMEEKNDEQE